MISLRVFEQDFFKKSWALVAMRPGLGEKTRNSNPFFMDLCKNVLGDQVLGGGHQPGLPLGQKKVPHNFLSFCVGVPGKVCRPWPSLRQALTSCFVS